MLNSRREPKPISQSSVEQRPWITHEAVKELPSSFQLNESDIERAIKEGVNQAGLASVITGSKLSDLCWKISDYWSNSSPYVEALGGRTLLCENGAGFGTSSLVMISCDAEGWSTESWYSRKAGESSVGLMVFMPDTGAIRCFHNSPFPKVSRDGLFANLTDVLKDKNLGDEFSEPPSSIKLNAFPRSEAMQSLIDHIQQEDEDLQLTRQQTEKIITPLLNRLDSVRSNITESLCGKLIPFAADIVKSGKPLELNAYNFTTTAGTDNKSVYLWAQTQYQPLITLLQRMEPNKLCDLVSAISKGKGEDEINAEIAQLFKCSPHLISVLSTSRPDAEQLSLVATLGRSNHVTSSLEWNGEDVDGRSILHRIISVYSALDDKGAAKLSDIFEAAKRNQLSPAQVAFSLLCNSIEEIQPSLSDRTQDPSIKVLPRLLREVKGDNQIAYRKLDKFKEVVRKAIADLESTMVRPLMSEKAGYRNALLSDKDGQNPGINEMIEKLMRQEGVNLGDYVELARAFYNVLVEDLIEEWPLAKPFTRQASIRTFCLAIMGGMDISKAGAYLRESPDKKRGKKENTYHIFRNKTSIYKRQLDQNYFFKANNDDSWARLMQVDFKGHLCNISPSPSKGYYSINERALEFSCDILDPNRGTSIGTLALRVKKNGDSYKVVTESVKVGEQQSNSFEKDGKVPAGYDLLAPDIKEFVDGLNAQTIDPELFKRVGDKVEEFKVALSNKIHEIIDRLHPEPQGGLGQALVTANKRFSGIFPWLVDLEEMWKLTDDVEGLLG